MTDDDDRRRIPLGYVVAMAALAGAIVWTLLWTLVLIAAAW
jgi:hypothetical protein